MSELFVPEPYQKTAIELALEHKRFGLFLPVGLGKSVCVLSVIAELKRRYLNINGFDAPRKTWLIIAPLTVCRTSWPQEIGKWHHTAGLKVLRLHGLSIEQRALALRQLQNPALRPDIVIVNFEQIAKLVNWFSEHSGPQKPVWPFYGLVIDESSKVKTPSTQRWKTLKRTLKLYQRVLILSATPVSQGLQGIWTQMYCLDYGEALGRTYSAFKRRYFEATGYNGYGLEPKEGADEEIEKRIAPVCLTLRGADHLNLPEVVEQSIEIDLPEKARKLYRQIEKQLMLELSETETITAVTAGVLTNKLSQIASGAAYLDVEDPDDPSSKREYRSIHDAKLDALAEFIEARQGAPFLLAYFYQFDRERLRKRFGPEVTFFNGSREQVALFGQGRIPVLALHPANAGHGIDGLQHGTCTVVWLGPTWSREQYEQLNGRVLGSRQSRSKFKDQIGQVYTIIARDTVDLRAYDACLGRGDSQQQFLEKLRNRSRVEHLHHVDPQLADILS